MVNNTKAVCFFTAVLLLVGCYNNKPRELDEIKNLILDYRLAMQMGKEEAKEGMTAKQAEDLFDKRNEYSNEYKITILTRRKKIKICSNMNKGAYQYIDNNLSENDKSLTVKGDGFINEYRYLGYNNSEDEVCFFMRPFNNE